MKNKQKLFIILIIIFIVAIISIICIRKYITHTKIIEKGYKLYGNEYCNGHGPIIVDGWPSYSTCEICGVKKHNDIPHSDFIICTQCVEITERCSKCGKLIKK